MKATNPTTINAAISAITWIRTFLRSLHITGATMRRFTASQSICLSVWDILTSVMSYILLYNEDIITAMPITEDPFY